MKKIIPFFIFLALASCKKESDATPDTVTDTISPDNVNKTAVVKTDSLSIYVAQINNNRHNALAALKNTSAAEAANKIYNKLVSENGLVLGKIDALEANFLEEFYTHFSGQESQIPDAALKGKMQTLKKGGLEFWDVGEGYAEIRTVPDYYKNIFAGKVTKDYQQYIELIAEDDKALWQGDAAIAISWDDLGKRVINWENFLKSYPDSNLRKSAEENFTLYRYGFLIGLDNTPVIDTGSNTMDTEARKAFEAFATKYPESPTTVYVKLLLEDVNNGDKVAKQVRINY